MMNQTLLKVMYIKIAGVGVYVGERERTVFGSNS